MPQVNFPIMLAVDWLEVFGFIDEPFSDSFFTEKYFFQVRPFGSKMWSTIFDVSDVEEGVVTHPFCTLCIGLRGKTTADNAVSIKLANRQLYMAGWQEKFLAFRIMLRIQLKNISRVDLAADFVFLKGRVSGSQLVSHLKNLEWWKCGSVVCSEHYSMPYSIKWAMAPEEMGYEHFYHDGKFVLHTESLTFGTKASFAQVCIYDKTLELNSHSLDGICEKEYIRDCWKQVGCFDPSRHTWRVEIRLNSKACTVKDPSMTGGLRPLCLSDLAYQTLPATFRLAADVWFRLVDATQGGVVTNIDANYCNKMRKRKSELPIVDLFPAVETHLAFSARPHQEKPSRFIKAMINRLERRANDIAHSKDSRFLKFDAPFLNEAARILRGDFDAASRDEKMKDRESLYEHLYWEAFQRVARSKGKHGSAAIVSAEDQRLFDFLRSNISPLSPAKLKEIEQQTLQLYMPLDDFPID